MENQSKPMTQRLHKDEAKAFGTLEKYSGTDMFLVDRLLNQDEKAIEKVERWTRDATILRFRE
jgi:hypothetical protein